MPGKASNAALHDDEDLMARMKRRRHNLDSWARKRKRVQASKGFHYPNSPQPPLRKGR